MTTEQKVRAWDDLTEFVEHLNVIKDREGFDGSVTEVACITDLVRKIKTKAESTGDLA